MDTNVRLARYEEVLDAIATQPYSYAVFEDAGRPGLVVQVAAGQDGEPAVMEATDGYEDGRCSLSADSRARLTALEFDVQAAPFPSRTVDVRQIGPVATVIDAAFLAMEAAPDFDVRLHAAEAGDRTWSDLE